MAEVRKGALVKLLETRPHLSKELEDIVNERNSANVAKGNTAAREAFKKNEECRVQREEAREAQTQEEILQVSRSLEFPRLMRVLDRARAARARDAVRSMSAEHKWDYAFAAAEKKKTCMMERQLKLGHPVTSKVGIYPEMQTFMLDLTSCRRYQIAGRSVRFDVTTVDDDPSALPSLMVSTLMEPIDEQPASAICPYGYMWHAHGKRAMIADAATRGERCVGAAVVEIHPDDPDIIDVKGQAGNSHSFCQGKYFISVFTKSTIDACDFTLSVSAHTWVAENGAAELVTSSYVEMASMQQCLLDTEEHVRQFRLHLSTRQSLAFEWCCGEPTARHHAPFDPEIGGGAAPDASSGSTLGSPTADDDHGAAALRLGKALPLMRFKTHLATDHLKKLDRENRVAQAVGSTSKGDGSVDRVTYTERDSDAVGESQSGDADADGEVQAGGDGAHTRVDADHEAVVPDRPASAASAASASLAPTSRTPSRERR